MSVKLLRAAVWNEQSIGLHRAAAIVSDDPALEGRTLIGAYARFLLVGADGVRLHEEVLYAGGWLPEGGRFQRLENLTTLGGVLSRALTQGKAAAPHLQARMAESWPRVEQGIMQSLRWRRDAREQSLEGSLARREDDERKRIDASLGRFETTLRHALHRYEDADALFSEFDLKDAKEQAPPGKTVLGGKIVLRASGKSGNANWLPSRLDRESAGAPVPGRRGVCDPEVGGSSLSTGTKAIRGGRGGRGFPPVPDGKAEHQDWLGLVDTNGPFLTLPVLLKTWPNLDALDGEMRPSLRAAHSDWQVDREAGRGAWIDSSCGTCSDGARSCTTIRTSWLRSRWTASTTRS